MSPEDPSKEKRYDPMESFRGMRDAYLTAMARTMTEAVNSEGYAQASGSVLDKYLTISGPVKESLDKSMLQALEQLSLPSRLDIISLAERFTNLELRLDDMDAKLDDLVKLSIASTAAAQREATQPPASKAQAAKRKTVPQPKAPASRKKTAPRKDHRK